MWEHSISAVLHLKHWNNRDVIRPKLGHVLTKNKKILRRKHGLTQSCSHCMVFGGGALNTSKWTGKSWSLCSPSFASPFSLIIDFYFSVLPFTSFLPMAPPLKTQLRGLTERGRQAVTVHFQVNIWAWGAGTGHTKCTAIYNIHVRATRVYNTLLRLTPAYGLVRFNAVLSGLVNPGREKQVNRRFVCEPERPQSFGIAETSLANLVMWLK